MFIKGDVYSREQGFNYILDNGTIINLETNLPIQFFDIESKEDTMPKGQLIGLVENMKRVSKDCSRYLDLTAPGRIHHFISYTDLLYWERF